MNRDRPRLLVLGSLPRDGQPVGGTVVSLAEMLDGLRGSGRLELDVLDTSRPAARGGRLARGWRNLGALTGAILRILRRAPHCDAVFLCASASAVIEAGPMIHLAVSACGKPLAVRLFGGDLDLALLNAPGWKRWLARRTWMRSRLVLLQTHALCALFADLPGLRWLPTTRLVAPVANLEPRMRRRCRRFLFMAQLRPEKGLAEALAAIDATPKGCTLSVYGPPMPGTDLALLGELERVRFHGSCSPASVQQVLRDHDALLFPSYHPGEGMPGAVVEAMQSGLPVIAARWRAIGELVEDEVTGLLVSPRSTRELAAAMTRLARDSHLCARLCSGARERGMQFDSRLWLPRLEEWLLELCCRPSKDAGPRSRTSLPEVSEVGPTPEPATLRSSNELAA